MVYPDLKREFGTQGALWKGGQDSDVAAGDRGNGWLNAAGYYPGGGGLTVPTWPTVDDFFRLPTALARELFRSIETWFQNQPFLIDPNAWERHHRLVKQYAEYFRDCGFEVDDYIRMLRVIDHRLKESGLHAGEGRGGDYNRDWEKFVRQYPAEDSEVHRARVLEHLDDLEKKYGVDKKGYLLPPRPKKRR